MKLYINVTAILVCKLTVFGQMFWVMFERTFLSTSVARVYIQTFPDTNSSRPLKSMVGRFTSFRGMFKKLLLLVSWSVAALPGKWTTFWTHKVMEVWYRWFFSFSIGWIFGSKRQFSRVYLPENPWPGWCRSTCQRFFVGLRLIPATHKTFRGSHGGCHGRFETNHTEIA